MKIIIDGLWGTGKTKISQRLKEGGFTYIQEPKVSNFHQGRIDRNVVEWFAKEHLRNMHHFTCENNAVLERSPLSNFLFRDQKNRKITKEIEGMFIDNTIFSILFLVEDLYNYPKYLEKINHKITNQRLSIADYEYYQNKMVKLYSKYSKKYFLIKLKTPNLPYTNYGEFYSILKQCSQAKPFHQK